MCHEMKYCSKVEMGDLIFLDDFVVITLFSASVALRKEIVTGRSQKILMQPSHATLQHFVTRKEMPK